MKKSPQRCLQEMYKKDQKDGLLFLKVLNLKLVIVGDLETLKKLFNHSECQDRMSSEISQILREERRMKSKCFQGIVFSERKVWSEQRKLASRALNDICLGEPGRLITSNNLFSEFCVVQGMEKIIQEEVELFMTFLSKLVHKPLDMRLLFALPVMNILWKLITGDRFDFDDSNLSKHIEMLKDSIKRISQPINVLKILFPWLTSMVSKVVKKNIKFNKYEDIMTILSKWLKNTKKH